MAKITPSKRGNGGRETISVKTKPDGMKTPQQGYKWWLARSKAELCSQLLETASFLKEMQQYRYRQAAIYARLYGNMPLYNFAGSSLNKLNFNNNLPIDRPTMNVVQSCTDTLVSRLTQSRPRPVCLTDNGDYKERNFAKQMNEFSNGELYQTKAYDVGELILRDGAVLGTGCVKVYEDTNKKMALERVLLTELLTDPNDAMYGFPRQLFQFKLVDRSVLADMFPDYRSSVAQAEQAFPDGGGESTRTISDQVIVVEGWHLPSGNEAGDGRHTIACTGGVIFDEEYKKERFPFAFLHYSPRILGNWGQGLAEQLMGTQVAINKILIQMDKSIDLITPVWLVEDGSKMPKAHFNNMLGRIQTYRGTLPTYQAPDPYSATLPQQLERLVQYAYQQSGISTLAATSQKPAGLDSGEAIRSYDDLQSDRFASLQRRYSNFYLDLTELLVDGATDIADRDGKYSTVYPNKDTAREIDLPKINKARKKINFQIFDSSSLPRDPAGRLQRVTEMMQSGMIDMSEGRRLIDYPDIDQVDKLANAAEERILKILDEIIESGKYTPPDPFMDIQLATKLVTQYYNMYADSKLEESRCQLLRDFFTQLQTLVAAAAPPPMAGAAPGGAPMAVPQSPPVSDVLPIAPQGA